MNTITMDNALAIHAELIQCLYNANGYGGDTAEIYCYRLTQQSPSYQLPLERTLRTGIYSLEDDKNARANLIQLINHVRSQFNVEFIEIDGLPFLKWVKETLHTGISHRVHVRMAFKKPTKSKKERNN